METEKEQLTRRKPNTLQKKVKKVYQGLGS